MVRGPSAEVDERSDVYSLGAILYELLAERPPLDVRGLPLHEAVRRVCEDEPVPLGRLDARLSGDLETIAATALEKRKDRRYPGAGALAADVRRHLAHEPIRARPPSRGYLLAKFVQRNRSPVGAGAIAVAGSEPAAGDDEGVDRGVEEGPGAGPGATQQEREATRIHQADDASRAGVAARATQGGFTGARR